MLKQVQDLAKTHGVHVTYNIVNNLTTHNKERVLMGRKRVIDYYVYVHTLDGKQIELEVFSDLEKGLEWGVKQSKEYLEKL